jgi:NAD(P)-dependent dehydrogenase (short-subunit alcohol dehydrogenase family)
MECAAAGDEIRVNTIHPGVIDTPIWTKLPASVGSNAPIDPNEVAKTGVPFGGAGAVPRLGRVKLHNRRGTGDRRRHDGRRATSLELNLMAWGSAWAASAECNFSGKFHSIYNYGRFR